MAENTNGQKITTVTHSQNRGRLTGGKPASETRLPFLGTRQTLITCQASFASYLHSVNNKLSVGYINYISPTTLLTSLFLLSSTPFYLFSSYSPTVPLSLYSQQMATNTARYTLVSAKNKWEEQGFHFDDSLPNYGLEQLVYNRLQELGWFRFAQQPARANYNWALEFYANNPDGEDNVIVRGRRVAANAATINALLDLPNDAPSFYAMLGALEDEDYETIKDYLCLEGTAWNTTGRNPYSVSRTQLLPEAKLWNTFVKRNLLPTSHNQTVDRTRLVLIHTILTGYRINVGEILAKELAAACSNDKGILAFPCLISVLCRRAVVPTSPSDKYQAEKKGWTRAVYM
ncbi:hypothetical protein V6N12_050371 [Hibiscus sabdariffa]|uniref:Putative plant transposon protein domain-containing protein n=1 Tax=Hibiscus sabdariffa TaxID=183260 RepID=A0ABR2GC66_9ROSI